VEKIVIDTGSGDYYARMEAAKARAEWELGDASWAGMIVGAFLWPDPDALAREMDDGLRAIDASIAIKRKKGGR
jgi:hypothetical protein